MDHQRVSFIGRVARFAWLPLCFVLAGCHLDMYDQAKYQTYEPSAFFEDGRSARPPVPNTVAVGQFQSDPAFLTGKDREGNLVSEFPLELTMDLVQEGQLKYNNFCAPCHGYAGNGDGIIAQRGPLQVPSLNTDRLREIQIGYFFDVITNGVNRMYSYGARVQPQDRWAIAAYIRALQLSQNAAPDDIPAELRGTLPVGDQ